MTGESQNARRPYDMVLSPLAFCHPYSFLHVLRTIAVSVRIRSALMMMSSKALSPIYTSSTASSYTYNPSTDSPPSTSQIQSFHASLPDFSSTPLTPLPSLAKDLGLGRVYVKNESSRLGLPAFKILGASWGTFSALCSLYNLSLTSSIEDVGQVAREKGVVLFAATDGNHGRAVARMAKILGVKARIFVPYFTDRGTRERIGSEGAEVVGVEGDYDAAVAETARVCEELTRSGKEEGLGVHIQDNAFEGYEVIPEYIVEGYSTMLMEVEEQLAKEGLKADAIVTPIGVGSLGTAVVRFAKSNGRGVKVVAVEPEAAACLNANLREGRHFTIQTGKTIMDGMCCGTVSPTAWPILKEGVDVSVTVGERECHDAVQWLQKNDVDAGPCGAGALAGFKRALEEKSAELGLRQDSVVVLLCTEGRRDYEVPN